jgi:hypothetical protein
MKRRKKTLKLEKTELPRVNVQYNLYIGEWFTAISDYSIQASPLTALTYRNPAAISFMHSLNRTVNAAVEYVLEIDADASIYTI